MDDDYDAPKKTRLFVGGLGATVTADDVRKTFSSLGDVASVEIIRSKGRSFAYFNFLPSSDNSLSKLFSTYNGCMWKGGRLKIEKAKEHYLFRLEREWAETAELANRAAASDADATRNIISAEMLKNVPKSEEMQLKIFFPKLRKIKSIPLKGSGKHKYSFQRLNVPPLPVHFCDCEEHSQPFDACKKESLLNYATEGAGINEKELNMMMTVMNSLIQKEDCPNPVSNKFEVENRKHDSIHTSADLVFDENNMEHETDEDDLVINISVHGKRQIPSLEGSMVNIANKVSECKRIVTSQHKSAQKDRQKKDVNSNRKRKLHPFEEAGGKELLSFDSKNKQILLSHLKESDTPSETQNLDPKSDKRHSCENISRKPIWKELVAEKSNTAFHISNLLPSVTSEVEESKSGSHDVCGEMNTEDENLERIGNIVSHQKQSKELKDLSEEEAVAANKIARGSSWLQKSSWTQLVTNSNSTIFSISQIFPDTAFEKQAIPSSTRADDVNRAATTEHEPNTSAINQYCLSGSNSLTMDGTSSTVDLSKSEQKPDVLQLEKEFQFVTMKNVSTPPVQNKSIFEEKQTYVGDSKVGETCPFMRSGASMREWRKAKAALSGSLKKKVEKQAH